MLNEHFLSKYKDDILIKMLNVLGMFIVKRILSDSHRMKFVCLFIFFEIEEQPLIDCW